MKKNIILITALTLISFTVSAQQYYYQQPQDTRYIQPKYTTQTQYYQQQPSSSASYGISPYLGVDYIYSMLNFKGETDEFYEKNYNNVRFLAGLKINPNFGIEGSFQLSDEQEKSAIGYIEGVGYADIKTKLKYYVYSLDVLGYLPVSQNFDLIGSLGGGIYAFKNKVTANTGYASADVSSDDTKFAPRLGIGAEIYFNNQISAQIMARGAYLHYDDLDYIVDLSAGFRFYFN